MKYNLLEEFKRSLEERVVNKTLGRIYSEIFFGFYISKEDLLDMLEYQKTQFIEFKENWFEYFHKSIRQTDFFDDRYVKIVNMTTEEEGKRRWEIIQLRERARKNGEPIPFTEELRTLNNKSETEVDVSVSSFGNMLIYNLICMDEHDDLMNAMEFTFKICS